MNALIDFVINIITQIINIIRNIFEWLVNKFLETSIFEKAIVITHILAFLAVVLPVARYYIFAEYFKVNNPLAVYLIAVFFLMFITTFFPSFIKLIIREIINGYYLFWVIYVHLSQGIIKTPYELTAGYYMNIIVPIIYMILSILSYTFKDEY